MLGKSLLRRGYILSGACWMNRSMPDEQGREGNQGSGSRSSKSNKCELHSLPSVLSILLTVSYINWMVFVTANPPSSLRPLLAVCLLKYPTSGYSYFINHI